jgi:predicted phosphodiesterase
MPRRRKPTSGKPVGDERAVVVSDLHVPYHDPVAVELVFDFLRWFTPDTLFINGDLLDFYALSRFSKDPERALSLQEELDQGQGLLERFRATLPKARLVFLEGNHEARLQRYLWDHPEVSKLKSLQMPALLGLEDLEIEHHGYQAPQMWRGVLIEHGSVVRKASAATAKAMLDQRGTSGISGHTHRLGMHYRTNYSETAVWAENGCLCALEPEYCIKPDWQQGFSVLHGWENRFLLEQIPILRRRLFYHGVLWER